jgi:hypothetical protein
MKRRIVNNHFARSARHCGWLSLAASAILLAGCNRSGLNLAPVEGLVTYNGAPLADASVMFKPDQGPFAMGVTDSTGKFSLMTANHEGAIIGSHQVAVSKAETRVRHDPSAAMPVYETKPLIPPKYFEVSTSNLTAEVVDDDNHFEFKL